MTASSTMMIAVALPPQHAEAAVYQAFLNAGLAQVAGGGGVMRGKAPMSWLSWGEDVVAIIAHGPLGAQIYLRSTCHFGLTLVDWGKNQENLMTILAALRALAPVV